MKRFLTVLLTAAMVLSLLTTMMVFVGAEKKTTATEASAEEVYLSDIKPKSWKIFGGTSADANPPHTPGYNVYFEDNSPLLLAGMTYEKGLSTHPDYAFDAELVYDISGYAFRTFSATVGKTDRYVAALPDSYTTFRVYVDGVLKDEVVDLKAGDTYFFVVDVTGGRELKLVTGGGSDGVTCEGVVWADALLSNDISEEETVETPTEDLYLSDIVPVRWKMYGGSSADANPPYKPGFNVFYEDNSPLMLGGLAYEKGLSIHPDGASDAEFVYDIRGRGYTLFSALVGKTDRYVATMPDSVTTFRVYVDGVLKDEVVDLPAGDTYLFVMDITGAKTLRLVTSGGSDNIFGDAVVWANAMLKLGMEECAEHSWNQGIVRREATCLENGEIQYNCTVCGHIKSESLQGQHAPGAWGIVEKATCTENGSKLQKCNVCHEELGTEVWEAKGHVPDVWVTIQKPTCTVAGKKTQSCKVCGEMMEEKEIAPEHDFGEWGVLDGQEVRICACGEKEVRDLTKTNGCSSTLAVGAVAMLVLIGSVQALLLRRKENKPTIL